MFTPLNLNFYDDGFNAVQFSLIHYADLSSIVFPNEVQETSKSPLMKFVKEFQVSSISFPCLRGGTGESEYNIDL